MNGVICRQCGGVGCITCNYTGYSKTYYKSKNIEGGMEMPKPKGHKPGCKCPFCKQGGKKSKKSASRKTTKRAAGGGVMHKVYTYTNKKGKRVTVKAHIEHPRKR